MSLSFNIEKATKTQIHRINPLFKLMMNIIFPESRDVFFGAIDDI